MNFNNPGALMKGLAKMQSTMAKVQKDVAETRYAGSAGGGLVKLEIFGTGKVHHIDIDPAALAEGSELVGDLVAAAVNDAITKREEDCKVRLKGVGKGLLPGMSIPGL